MKIVLIFLGHFGDRRGVWEGLSSGREDASFENGKETLTAIEPKGEKDLCKKFILKKHSTDDHLSVPDLWPEMFCGNRECKQSIGPLAPRASTLQNI